MGQQIGQLNLVVVVVVVVKSAQCAQRVHKHTQTHKLIRFIIISAEAASEVVGIFPSLSFSSLNLLGYVS